MQCVAFRLKNLKIRSKISEKLRFRTSQPREDNRTPPVNALDTFTSISVEEEVKLVRRCRQIFSTERSSSIAS